jgi:phosphoribosyl-AMP cyclohydrolase / phosphoribosyl-ATP pyrophosphohydrolase
MNVKPQFEKYADGLVPAIVQDAATDQVLMLGFMSEASLEKSVETGLVTFHSRSRNEIWTKGETSGNSLRIEKILSDCDNDTLLIKAMPAGPTCHTGSRTCFNGDEPHANKNILFELQNVIDQRRSENSEDSYTAKFFSKGINKIAQKVGEEAVELVIEAKDDNIDAFKSEAADLLFHFLVLLRAKDVALDDVLATLTERRKV